MSFTLDGKYFIDPIGYETPLAAQPRPTTPAAERLRPEFCYQVHDSATTQPVGGLWLFIEQTPDNLISGVITGVNIHQEHRGHGLGSDILRFAEETAKDAGASQLEVGSVSSAVPFYEANGFVTANAPPGVLTHMFKEIN